MAANAFANIAAANTAGYITERFVAADNKNHTRLKKSVSGLPGASGGEEVFPGEGSSSAAADAAALANLNAWRNSRYGSDSAAASLSPLADGNTTPSSQGIARTHQALTKDVS
jgi:hypothetical protein